MLDDREFYGLLNRVLASGLRKIEEWELARDGDRACIHGDVDYFLRQHDARRFADCTADDDVRYFNDLQNLANKAASYTGGWRLKQAIDILRLEAAEREREAFLGRIIPRPFDYWQPVRPCERQKPLRFMEPA